MDYNSLLTLPRWQILDILSRRGSSPIEISRELHTSVAYISQQLKLLEAASLINKKKTGLAEKGKPRLVFSLAKELSYITVMANNFSEKKLINLTDHHKAILRIWFINLNESEKEHLEKIYFGLEKEISEIEGLFIDLNSKILYVVSESKSLKQRLSSLTKNKETVMVSFISLSDLSKMNSIPLYPIYDTKILTRKELKGGNQL